jgi:hypothetical protein
MSNINRTWSLREELYAVMHRWPTMIALFALGCLLGWGLSFVWPPFYQATAEVYVGLNPYRTFSDTNFLALSEPKYSNLDNYNYWQMSQLQGMIFLDKPIAETLKELRQQDPYWEKVSNDDLRNMLSVEWRTAGTWSLIAQSSNSKYASQAAKTWSQVVTSNVKDAVTSSRNTFMVDQKLNSIGGEQVKSTLRQQQLLSTRKAIQSWVEAASNLPKDQPLQSTKRWELLSLITGLAQYKPSWMALLQAQPAPDALPEVYLSWISQINQTIDDELPVLRQQVSYMEDQYTTLAQQYAVESDKSYGLSPNLEVQGIKDLPAKVMRPSGTLIIIGGIVGLLVWILIQLITVTHRAKNQ